MRNIHREIIGMCDKLDMPMYQRILLSEMVYRRVKCPEEGISELLHQAAQTAVPRRYKKRGKSCMRVSDQKEMRELEEKLHACRNLPQRLVEGDIVQNTVESYYRAVCGLE